MKTQVFDLGNVVLCDICGEDYTDSAMCGGILFGSNACCPECAVSIEKDAVEFGETGYIKGRCPKNVKFSDWCILLRGNNDKIKITSWEPEEDLPF